MKKEIVELGTFEVVSGVLRISDPCYDKDTWCAGIVDNVLNGTWKAQVLKKTQDNWGHRCRKLCTVHESFDKSKVTVKKLKIDVGVDSGQAGVFDDIFYQVPYSEPYLEYGRDEYDTNQSNHSDKNLHALKAKIAMLTGEEPPKEKTRDEKDRDHVSFLKTSYITGMEEELRNYTDSKEDYKREYAEHIKKNIADAKATVARYEANPCHDSLVGRTTDWYRICCDKTLSNIGAGVIRNGVVSSSGFGDGSYTAYAAYNLDGKVVGIKILF